LELQKLKFEVELYMQALLKSMNI